MTTANPRYSSVFGFVTFLRLAATAFAIATTIAILYLVNEVPDCIELTTRLNDCTDRTNYIAYLVASGISAFFFTLILFSIAYALDFLARAAGFAPHPFVDQASRAAALNQSRMVDDGTPSSQSSDGEGAAPGAPEYAVHKPAGAPAAVAS